MNETVAYESYSSAVAAPVSVSAEGRRLNICLWLLLAVTNVVDILATRRAFEIGISELNPIVDMFYAEFGMGSVAAFKALFLGMLCLMIPYIRSWTRVLLMLACGIYSALTIFHIWYLTPLL